MSYPVCTQCGDKGPHRIVWTGRAKEIWRCGYCDERFIVEIATIEDAGEGAPGQGPGTVATSDDCTQGPEAALSHAG